MLDVIDEGRGVVADDRSRIFESFYQGPPPVEGRVKGSGLGLAIAREYALAQGAVSRSPDAATARAAHGSGFAANGDGGGRCAGRLRPPCSRADERCAALWSAAARSRSPVARRRSRRDARREEYDPDAYVTPSFTPLVESPPVEPVEPPLPHRPAPVPSSRSVARARRPRYGSAAVVASPPAAEPRRGSADAGAARGPAALRTLSNDDIGRELPRRRRGSRSSAPT